MRQRLGVSGASAVAGLLLVFVAAISYAENTAVSDICGAKTSLPFYGQGTKFAESSNCDNPFDTLEGNYNMDGLDGNLFAKGQVPPGGNPPVGQFGLSWQVDLTRGSLPTDEQRRQHFQEALACPARETLGGGAVYDHTITEDPFSYPSCVGAAFRWFDGGLWAARSLARVATPCYDIWIAVQIHVIGGYAPTTEDFNASVNNMKEAAKNHAQEAGDLLINASETSCTSTANQPPTVTLSMLPEEPTIEDTITFAANASDPDGDELTYEWVLNGERQDVSGSNVDWSEPVAGDHTLTVKVSDGKGGTAEASVQFTVGESGCHPAGQESELGLQVGSGSLGAWLPKTGADDTVRPLLFECHAPPRITGISIPAKIPVNVETPWTVSFSNPGEHYTMTLTIEEPGTFFGWNTTDTFEFDAGGAKQGTYSLIQTCTEPGSYQFRAIVNNIDGDSEPYHYSFECVGNTSASRPTLTKEEKAALKIAAENWGASGDVVAFFSIACVSAPEFIGTKVCAIIGGLIAGGMKLNGRRLSMLARDPADPNFTEIAEPITPQFTPISPGPDLPQGLADAGNDLLYNLAESIGLSAALLHALERAQGAFEAGESFWEDEQMSAAARYASQLAALMAAQPGLSSAFASAWQAAGFPDLSLNEEEILRLQAQIAANGLPSSFVEAMRQFGADSTDIEEIQRDMIDQEPQALAGSFLDGLADPALSEAAQGVEQALRGFASSVGGTPPPPGPPNPPPNPPGGKTLAQALDLNNSGILDDGEIRQAIQYWILGQAVPGTDQTIDDPTIRQLIQMWILGEPVSAADAASAQRFTGSNALEVQAIQLSAPTGLERTLRVQGQGIAEVRLQVFDLSGRLVLHEQGSGSALRFSLLNAQGQPLANGVYLYVVSVQGLDGQRWQSEVRKLVVMR